MPAFTCKLLKLTMGIYFLKRFIKFASIPVKINTEDDLAIQKDKIRADSFGFSMDGIPIEGTNSADRASRDSSRKARLFC
jgi:hypothetical protein